MENEAQRGSSFDASGYLFGILMYLCGLFYSMVHFAISLLKTAYTVRDHQDQA
jgi:hypothetical protein